MRKAMFIILSIIYIGISIWLLFFFPFTSVNRQDTTVERHINAVPFETTRRYFENAWKYANWPQTQQLLFNVGGNILLFVPMGVIFCQLSGLRDRWWAVFLLGFLISSSVETLQILSRRGNFDVDDIMLNSLGTLLGFWLSRFILPE